MDFLAGENGAFVQAENLDQDVQGQLEAKLNDPDRELGTELTEELK